MRNRLVLLALLLGACQPTLCKDSPGIALEVLGSGGPIPDDARASSSYLLWLDGEARLLVDVGGGAFVRFGEAGARLETLDAVAITHLHTDHVADLPALLKGGYFSQRTRPLLLAGPSGNQEFPGIREFVQGLFHPQRGIFRYLSGYLEADPGRLFPLELVEVEHTSRSPQRLLDSPELRVEAIGVEHGIVPALAYVITVGGHRIAISGDLNANNPAFTKLARGADLLIIDHAIPEDAGRIAARLHIRPSEIGNMAAEMGVHTLVLSHHMARSLRTLDRDLDRLREHFDGPLVLADDHTCLPLE